MRFRIVLTIIAFSFVFRGIAQSFEKPLYKNPNAPAENRVKDLLGRMTLAEKIGQLCCPLGWEMYTKAGEKHVQPSAKFIEQMDIMPVGAFWATLRADPWTKKTLKTGLNPELAAHTLNGLQKYAVENTRLGIPIFFAEECVHGHMAIGTTVFPTGIGLASTWNRELIKEVGSVIGLEARLQGAHIGYGPVLDVAREPRWSRMEETFGEDPVLSGILGSAFVKGMQGGDIADGKHVYSTLKHFAAYGIPVGGHNGQKALVGTRELFSDYLLPFKMAIDSGAQTIMTSYNSIDGIPCTSNRFLLTDVLRNQWHFSGFVFSDLGSIEGIATTHRVASDIKNAAALAIKAGVDMDLGGNAFGKHLEKAVKEGSVSMADIDSAVCRVLRLKFKMGLFENPYVNPDLAKNQVRNIRHKTLAREVAKQSIILLKNNGILPLSKNLKSISVIGPNADNVYNQLGDYTAPQDTNQVITVLKGIKRAVSPTTIVRYAKGCAIRDTAQSNIDEAVKMAKMSDVVVLVVGGSSARDFKTEYLDTGAAAVSNKKEETIPDMESGEGYDRCTLTLLGDQEKLINALAEIGKPLIIVYIAGRPLNMNNASEKADALLTAWYPGEEGGTAVGDVLFGDYNPAGRLPVSVPRSIGQLPVNYSLGKQADYVEGTSSPLYAFGYGLSYTGFEYSDLSIDRQDDKVQLSCKVTNTGSFDGDEVVQLYVRDNVSSVTTPPIQLKDFQRIFIKKGETEAITFTLTADDLSLYNQQMMRTVEPGEFTVMIGTASNDIRLKGIFFYK
ncbi:glycoside hydrolase family 3 N-terminal domain-containing protein [Anaerorudis cellulosivorans]|uniref:glycoside hydrolase family 3 N-terminal domain-containing protein n=1 Tax=Anaerorudis cellulosivorans TaxID=3397862 RepID=UPI00221FCEDC|nr:glycoside hydrolase family 3 N-terminal domain-containing protein [Seramator thermalis]MCW1735328.1 glycoside hydrolase family 3 C-terminal domain-containing protein [Seramator thermalis]